MKRVFCFIGIFLVYLSTGSVVLSDAEASLRTSSRGDLDRSARRLSSSRLQGKQPPPSREGNPFTVSLSRFAARNLPLRARPLPSSARVRARTTQMGQVTGHFLRSGCRSHAESYFGQLLRELRATKPAAPVTPPHALGESYGTAASDGAGYLTLPGGRMPLTRGELFGPAVPQSTEGESKPPRKRWRNPRGHAESLRATKPASPDTPPHALGESYCTAAPDGAGYLTSPGSRMPLTRGELFRSAVPQSTEGESKPPRKRWRSPLSPVESLRRAEPASPGPPPPELSES
jgi:hypothetical protein